MNPVKKVKAYLMLREAVIKANAAHAKNGSRYYVVPSTDGKLIVLNRDDLKRLRMKHYTSHKTTTHDLLSSCFYHTSHANGTGAMSDEVAEARRQAFFEWFDSL